MATSYLSLAVGGWVGGGGGGNGWEGGEMDGRGKLAQIRNSGRKGVLEIWEGVKVAISKSFSFKRRAQFVLFPLNVFSRAVMVSSLISC